MTCPTRSAMPTARCTTARQRPAWTPASATRRTAAPTWRPAASSGSTCAATWPSTSWNSAKRPTRSSTRATRKTTGRSSSSTNCSTTPAATQRLRPSCICMTRCAARWGRSTWAHRRFLSGKRSSISMATTPASRPSSAMPSRTPAANSSCMSMNSWSSSSKPTWNLSRAPRPCSRRQTSSCPPGRVKR